MNRTYVRRRRVLVAIVLVASLVPVARAAAGSQGTQPPAQPPHYAVQPGDSLWSIAESYSDGSDPRPLIRLIQERNGVNADSLQAGQSLLIPVA